MLRSAEKLWLVAALAACLAGCWDSFHIAEPDTPKPPAFLAIVSDVAVVGPGQRPGLAAAADGEVTYISLPPGTIPEGELATILNRRTGATATTRMAEGGFDPVAVYARSGDTLQVEVRLAGNAASVRSLPVVPPKRRPIVVRTDPPPQKRDVPLNASLVIVFSEPIDPATLTRTSVHLLRDGAMVEGSVAVVPDKPWIARFLPDSSLALDMEYQLVVTGDVRDLDGDPLDPGILVPFSTASGVVALQLDQTVAGGRHSCLLDIHGQGYCWGDNSVGQLGGGSTAPAENGSWIVGSGGFTKLVAGNSHTCALRNGGTVDCWGANGSGQLGDGTTTIRTRPFAVSGSLRFAGLTAGRGHTCGHTGEGTAYCWGGNDQGQLGNGAGPGPLGDGHSPVPVAVLGGLRFTSLAAGGSHTCGLGVSGAAYCWGANDSGQLGIGLLAPRTTPAAVSGGLVFSTLVAGERHTCGLTPSGAAYCWGANPDGRLGDGTSLSRSSPVAVTGGRTFTALDVGDSHSCGLSGAGLPFCWGANGDGQLGNGSFSNSPVPVAVSGGLSFDDLALGSSHVCGLSSWGVYYCWGNNSAGQVLKYEESTWVPVAVRSVWDY